MKNTVYDHSFNENEWFVIITILVGILVIRLLRKKLPIPESLFTLMFGVTVGLIFDHTIAVPPFDYYDVGDQAKYQYFDMFSYLMYAPFGYIFIYLFLRLNIKGFYTILYIVLWTTLGIGIEWLAHALEVFHYKNGYKLMYSIPIYLFIQSIHLCLFLFIFGWDWHINKVKVHH